MAGYEWLAVAYFTGLACASPWTAVPRGRRAAVAAAAATLATAVALAGWSAPSWLRAWLPHAYLVAGYWLPGLLVTRVERATSFERWLLATDVRLRPWLPAVPRSLVGLTELSYLWCYPLVPVAFAAVWALGSGEAVARYWMAVLLAGYACYASLPWLVSRPPRVAAPHARAPHPIGRLNTLVLGGVSHHLNTFPSGHVAVACAAAVVAATVSLPAGAAVALLAVGIAVGAAAGRYHYVMDVLLGLVVGLGAAALALG